MSRRSLRRLLPCSLLVAFTVMNVEAHEIGTTRVSVSFEAGPTYRIDVETDAESLVEKLERAAGTSSDAGPRDSLAARLRALDGIFRTRVNVSFDGANVVPEIDYIIEPPADDFSPAGATIRLFGTPPAGVRFLTWSYGWTFASYALTVNRDEVARSSEWLEGGEASSPVLVATPDNQPSRLATAVEYMWLGITHIVPKGLDHMLFVLGIFLLNQRLRPVLWQVSAFTIAHSITLALSIYGFVTLRSSIVEPLIAASIAYVAVENLFRSELKRRRIVLVFACGLLHGLGFAGVLGELALPSGEFATALVAFNLGVELGQLTVIGAAFLLVGWQCGDRVWYRQRIVIPASLAIAGMAIYWTFERAAGL